MQLVKRITAVLVLSLTVATVTTGAPVVNVDSDDSWIVSVNKFDHVAATGLHSTFPDAIRKFDHALVIKGAHARDRALARGFRVEKDATVTVSAT